MKTYLYIDDDVFKPDGYRKPQQYYQKYFPQYLPLFEHYRDFQKVIMVNSGITAIQLMEKYGCPDVISFDNDLGQQTKDIISQNGSLIKTLIPIKSSFHKDSHMSFIHKIQ